MADKPKFNETLRAKNIITRGKVIKGIVLHDTAGNGGHGDTRYLAAPGDGRKVGVDFTVERDGSIWKLNPDLKKYCTPHAGRNTKFKGEVNGRVNRITVGIEIVQKANLSLKPLYPLAQVKAVAELCAWLCEEFKLDSADITTHRQIVTDGSRSDPRKFPFTEPDGFWHHFWVAKGNGQAYLASLTEPILPASPEDVSSPVNEIGEARVAELVPPDNPADKAPDVESGSVKEGESAPDKPASPGEPVVGGRPDDPPIQASQGSNKSLIATALGTLAGGAAAIKGFISSNAGLISVGILCVTIVLLALMFRQVLLDWLRIKLAASPDKYNAK